MAKISKDQVLHMSRLAKIPVKDEEVEGFAEGFSKTLDAVDELFKVDVSGIEPTHQVSGLENVLREDKTDDSSLSQEDALKNAKKKHDGYFVVDQILAED